MDNRERLLMEAQLQQTHLGAIIAQLWPDTDLRWMESATRVGFIARWLSQACSWLAAIGATPEEISTALIGVTRRWENEAGAWRRRKRKLLTEIAEEESGKG